MMKRTLAVASALAAFAFAAATPAQAQMKVGVVDMNKVFSDYYKTKDAETRINEARAAAKKEMDDRMEARQKLLDEINNLNKEVENKALSASARDEKGKQRDEKINETRNLEREITEFKNTRERQLQEQAVRMRNGIVEEIMKIVNDKVKADGYDLVFDKSGSSLNGVPILLYSKDGMEFTNDVVTALNRNKPAAGSAPAAAAATPAAKPAATPKK
ncbi:MAG: OmpH family outer membrane protein [Verrucomicrobia bacterium]|nr:OmpH family outer membrane protein [Verrucomicrobiota bacterium]